MPPAAPWAAVSSPSVVAEPPLPALAIASPAPTKTSVPNGVSLTLRAPLVEEASPDPPTVSSVSVSLPKVATAPPPLPAPWETAPPTPTTMSNSFKPLRTRVIAAESALAPPERVAAASPNISSASPDTMVTPIPEEPVKPRPAAVAGSKSTATTDPEMESDMVIAPRSSSALENSPMARPSNPPPVAVSEEAEKGFVSLSAVATEPELTPPATCPPEMYSPLALAIPRDPMPPSVLVPERVPKVGDPARSVAVAVVPALASTTSSVSVF
mmetsp:Transcript_6713/g.17322  ORF Transcript_6713/g.17322 Transcript_6713/m.17322 type:complete len:270 (+) Transcript_6713:1145-1954(+)